MHTHVCMCAYMQNINKYNNATMYIYSHPKIPSCLNIIYSANRYLKSTSTIKPVFSLAMLSISIVHIRSITHVLVILH